jgi:hypothetical protein
MIAGPSTEILLRDCARELLERVLPYVEGDLARVRVVMLEQVLRNAAERAAHEIAWMVEETGDMRRYARAVLNAEPGVTALAAAVEAADARANRNSLHLDDVIDTYRYASEALSCALEAAIASGDQSSISAGAALLAGRSKRERLIMSGWGELAGR